MKSSSVLKGESKESYAPRNLLDPTSSTGFASANQPNQWVEWDFQERLITLTDYAIRIGTLGLIRSWKLEGSLDGTKWMHINSQSNLTSLTLKRPVVSFSVGVNNRFRHLKLTQTEPPATLSPATNEEVLSLGALEVFGTLSSDEGDVL
jgi:hypothetical protein